MRKLAAAIATLLLLTLGSPAFCNLSYNLETVIEPAAGSVAVHGTIVVPVAPGQAELTFTLHRTFAISRLTVDGKPAAFAYQVTDATPFNPASRKVAIKLPLRHGDTVRLSISYAGTLEKIPEWGTDPGQKWAMDDQVNHRLVELAYYSSWYPQFFEFGRRFDSRLTVSLPAGWTAVSGGATQDLGIVARRATTRWQITGNTDITVTAAPNFRKVTSPGIEIYHTDMPAILVQNEARDLSAVLTLFRKRLGETAVPGGVVRHVFAPMLHGQGRAGIARPGLIVTSEGRVREALAAKPNYSLFQDIAHEIGHFWWNFGTGQGDWINESFAEYFSALAVRDLVSAEAFEKVLEGYRKRVGALTADTPAIGRTPKEGGNFYVRYYKGSLMLDELRRSMGDDAFFLAARDFLLAFRDKGAGTEDFRAFWTARANGDAKRLDAWLDADGGVPVP